MKRNYITTLGLAALVSFSGCTKSSSSPIVEADINETGNGIFVKSIYGLKSVNIYDSTGNLKYTKTFPIDPMINRETGEKMSDGRTLSAYLPLDSPPLQKGKYDIKIDDLQGNKFERTDRVK